MTVRVWLRANGYNDVAEAIDDILAEFKGKGSRERRNWADVLCGNKGKPVTIAGRTFPMLASAQVSRGLPVSPERDSAEPRRGVSRCSKVRPVGKPASARNSDHQTGRSKDESPTARSSELAVSI